MDMTIKDEIEQLILRCIASDGLKACPKDLAFLEKYGLKNLFFFSVEYGMEGADTQSLHQCSFPFPFIHTPQEREVRHIEIPSYLTFCPAVE